MKFSTRNKTNIFILFLVVVLLFNSYRNSKSTVKEGYSGGSKDINNKYENLKNVIAMLQAEISLIKDTINRKINRQ